MLSTPPKTGNATLDTFLQEIYQKSLELEEKTIPEEGWSLTDLRSDLSEVISDKRDLIDIVTKYDDLKGHSEAVSAQKEYLDSILAETRKIDEHSQWFAEIMEWWDQNYRVIQDSKATMSSTAAADYAADAKTSEANAKASEIAAEGHADDAAASATKTGQDVVKTAADRVAVENAATSASWSGDSLNILGTTSPSLRGPKGDPGKDATGGGIVVVGSKEEAAALPIGTVYAITTEVSPSEPAPGPDPNVNYVGNTTFADNMKGWWKPEGITLTAADGVLTAVADTERAGGYAVFASPRVLAPAGTYEGSVMVENPGTEAVTVQIKVDPVADSAEKVIPAGGSALAVVDGVDLLAEGNIMLFVNTASATVWPAGTTLKFTDPMIRASSA